MLKNLSPLLSPDLLHALASMGHGDRIVIVDAHFPGAALARRLVRLPGVSAPQVLDAVLSVLPLDDYVPDAAFTMQVVGDAATTPPAVVELIASLKRHDARAPVALERNAFYAQAAEAFAIVQCGDTRTYANMLLVKGVVQ